MCVMQRLSASWLVDDDCWKGLRAGSVSLFSSQRPILNVVQNLQLPEGIRGEFLCRYLALTSG